MTVLLVDTHAHLDVAEFHADRDAVIARSEAEVGHIITVGTDLASSRKAIELSERYQNISAAVGIHPHEVSNVKPADIAALKELARHKQVIAIGETGLDYYRDYSPRNAQLEVLEWQIALAKDLGLPVIIHCRQAESDMLDLLHKGRRQYRGVIHCFSSDARTAREYLDLGFYLSLGGYIGYSSSRGSYDIIRNIPEDHLLVETDCPFLPPQSYRGKRNEPSYLPLTVKALAAIRGLQFEDIAAATTRNARELFKIPAKED